MDYADALETIQIVQHREKAFGDEAQAHTNARRKGH